MQSVKEAKVSNYLVVAIDTALRDQLEKEGIPVYYRDVKVCPQSPGLPWLQKCLDFLQRYRRASAYTRQRPDRMLSMSGIAGGQGSGGNGRQPRYLSLEVQNHTGVFGAGLECAAF